MNRRQFLQTSAAALAASSLRSFGVDFADQHKRVGLIGCGWYGKADLFRLIQVAPVEVVSLCDVDKKMLADAAEMTSTRQASKKKPRTYSDFREMLKEKDLDVVLIATPDHWHALAMIEAVKSGADVYVQKPIGVDVTEGAAMLAAARKYNRVVQVGTQRRSTPHLMEAREQIVRAGKARQSRARRDLLLLSHADHGESARHRASGEPRLRNVDRPRADAALTINWFTRASWRAFMEYGNGIVGDMAIHMFDMTRWMLGLGWPTRISSTGGIFIDKASKANITDTQNAIFEYEDLRIVWTHRSWGDAPDRKYPWAATLYGDKGTLKADVYGYDFIPQGKGESIRRDVTYELEQYPEDKTEKDLEKHCAPAIRGHMKNFLAAIAERGRPVADIEQGHISSASCIMANVAMKLGRTLNWDSATGKVVGDDEANRLLARPYRAPWTHPTPDSV